jgi:hypothetical protein
MQYLFHTISSRQKSELNDKYSDVQIMESRPKYEYKPMPTSSIKCESIDSLEAHTGCDCNDRRKRVKIVLRRTLLLFTLASSDVSRSNTFIFLSCVWFEERRVEALCKDVPYSFLSVLMNL